MGWGTRYLFPFSQSVEMHPLYTEGFLLDRLDENAAARMRYRTVMVPAVVELNQTLDILRAQGYTVDKMFNYLLGRFEITEDRPCLNALIDQYNP